MSSIDEGILLHGNQLCELVKRAYTDNLYDALYLLAEDKASAPTQEDQEYHIGPERLQRVERCLPAVFDDPFFLTGVSLELGRGRFEGVQLVDRKGRTSPVFN